MGVRSIVAVVLALGLSGCFASREQIAKQDADECVSYGAQPGSQAYFQCRMAKDQQHAADRAQRRAALQSMGDIKLTPYQMQTSPSPVASPAPAYQLRTPTTTNCMRMGSGVNCTTF